MTYKEVYKMVKRAADEAAKKFPTVYGEDYLTQATGRRYPYERKNLRESILRPNSDNNSLFGSGNAIYDNYGRIRSQISPGMLDSRLQALGMWNNPYGSLTAPGKKLHQDMW